MNQVTNFKCDSCQGNIYLMDKKGDTKKLKEINMKCSSCNKITHVKDFKDLFKCFSCHKD